MGPRLQDLSLLIGLAIPLGAGLLPSAVLAQGSGPTGTAGVAAGTPKTEEANLGLYLGAWALTDSQNNLFNVRVLPGGRAVSTIGTLGVPPAGARRLTDSHLRQEGHWQAGAMASGSTTAMAGATGSTWAPWA